MASWPQPTSGNKPGLSFSLESVGGKGYQFQLRWVKNRARCYLHRGELNRDYACINASNVPVWVPILRRPISFVHPKDELRKKKLAQRGGE